ncbi:MAG: ferritin-like domain-containing protein [Gemmatimonadota bacterium]|nr:ferritin-like domain-containing protein [Gemmatimonadota bacterium]
MATETLKSLYMEQLKDLYSAETQMLPVLPRLADAASDAELKDRFRRHQAQTETHAKRLEEIFEHLGEEPTGHRCKGMEGLVKEAEEMLNWKVDPDVLDAGLIAASQRMEHYEIAGYGCVRTYARMLDLKEHQRLLQDTLDEEGGMDHDLTGIAEDDVNRDALQ